MRTRLAELAGKGIGAAIIDAVFDRDLETIGLVAVQHRLSVGASGMGLGLARALVSTGKVTSTAASSEARAAVGGPAACLAGSCSQATLQQIANAERVMPVLHLDPDRITTGEDEAQRALAWAKPRLADGPVLIASSSTPDQVAALQARHGRDAAGHAIEQAMADIAEGLVGAGVRRLVVAGGETSGAVVDRLGPSLYSAFGTAGLALARFRIPESAAKGLPQRTPPAWVFLHGLKSPLSSTALRAARARQGG